MSSGVENSFPFGTCYVEEIYGCLDEMLVIIIRMLLLVFNSCLYPNDLDGDPCLVCTGDGNGNMSFSYQDLILMVFVITMKYMVVLIHKPVIIIQMLQKIKIVNMVFVVLIVQIFQFMLNQVHLVEQFHLKL